MVEKAQTRVALMQLSHELGAEQRQLAVLGEGNTSAKAGDDSFFVKASGSSLGVLAESDVVECLFAPLLLMLDREDLTDEEVENELFGCRVDPVSKKPSVEALFHAWLLSLHGISFVGHVHSIAVNRILCSPRAREFAEHRLFPDEIVCCGPASVFVPYTDPGLKLSQVIRTRTLSFVEKYGTPPRIILLENHGLIAIGGTASAVTSAIYMADKAARIFTGAAAMGGPRFLDPEQVDRIANRIDEHYRQRALNL
jgi:rhamnose utilization protein RhaD (predicted bifunctional aldolase and dehydrogenase)